MNGGWWMSCEVVVSERLTFNATVFSDFIYLTLTRLAPRWLRCRSADLTP